MLDQGGDAEDLLEHAKLEMFLDQVFVFTPKGKLISLPTGAMPLDFAYAVHSDVGDTCVGVKINGEPRPLRTTLVNGDVVEVVRGAAAVDPRRLAEPDRHRARPVRHPPPHAAVREGRVRPARQGGAGAHASAAAGKTLADVSLRPALDRFAAPNDAELFQAVGRNRIAPTQVLEAIFPGLADSDRDAAAARQRLDDGSALDLRPRQRRGAGRPTCTCRPAARRLPGDRIVGVAGAGGILDVHTIDCAMLARHEAEEDHWVDLQWTPEAERNTLSRARLHATIRDAPGVLGQACTIIGEAGANIIGVNMRHRHSDFFDVDFDVEVKDARHLTHVAAALRANPSVETVERAQGAA